LASGSTYNNTTGAYDSRDLNRDGHVSMGEKLKTGAMPLASGSTYNNASGISYNNGAYDSRDLNRDGHVSMGEKLGATGMPLASGTTYNNASVLLTTMLLALVTTMALMTLAI